MNLSNLYIRRSFSYHKIWLIKKSKIHKSISEACFKFLLFAGFINFSFHSKNLYGNTLLLLSMLITNLPIKSYQIPKTILILYTMCINPLRANPQNGHTLKQFVCKLHQRQYYFHNIA